MEIGAFELLADDPPPDELPQATRPAVKARTPNPTAYRFKCCLQIARVVDAMDSAPLALARLVY